MHKLERELDRRAEMIDRLSDDMIAMRGSFSKLLSSASEEDGSYTTYAEYDRLNSRATQISRQVDTIFSNSIEFTRQRTVMDRVVEEGRVHMEHTEKAVEAIHSQLDEVNRRAQSVWPSFLFCRSVQKLVVRWFQVLSGSGLIWALLAFAFAGEAASC